jgi:hypothetical protein
VGLVIECVLIDCHDLERMNEFWQAALHLEHVWTGPSGGYLLKAQGSASISLALMPCGGEKRGKNRLHLDSGQSEFTSASGKPRGSSWRTRREMSFVYCAPPIRLRARIRWAFVNDAAPVVLQSPSFRRTGQSSRTGQSQ